MVRHPWERLVSAYQSKYEKHLNKSLRNDKAYRHYVRPMLKKQGNVTFSRFIAHVLQQAATRVRSCCVPVLLFVCCYDLSWAAVSEPRPLLSGPTLAALPLALRLLLGPLHPHRQDGELRPGPGE